MNKQIQPQSQAGIDQQAKNITTSHSLSADIAMGWKPNLKVIGPVPLNFDNPYIDKSIKQILKSQASFYYVCYLGPRPSNTFKLHEIIAKNYRYKYAHLYSVDYGHLKSFFHKFYNEFQPLMKRPFQGMNPNRKTHPLTFDSSFQSGNLDCAVKVNQNEYDLIIRIDSNTAGHIMWYYFRISNPQSRQKTIRFNIVNLRNNKSCYQRGMKPYMRKSSDNAKWSQWAQQGNNLEMTQERIRFGKQSLIFQNNMITLQQQVRYFRCLSFDITFQPLQSYQVAYCIPYTYSDLINDIKFVKKQCQQNKKIYLQVDNSNESLSGLEIPILKITDYKKDQNSNKNQYKQQDQKKKFAVFIIGRQHPGQSNSSHVMKGILKQLVMDCPQSQYLRKKCIFKIIPMLNVDGVVIGNFRTSLYGKDLNRLFKKNQLFLIPQVQMCKNQFTNLQRIHKKKILSFLDIHGHSARRNSFCYGPGILDANAFSDVRELAKIISTKTQIFRYPSCTFRINNDKKTTARACFSKSVGVAYTIQSSNWSYYSKSNAKMMDFTIQSWNSVGQGIIDGVVQYLYQKMKRKITKKRKGQDDNEEEQQQFVYIQKTNANSKPSKFILQKSRKMINNKQKFRLSINRRNRQKQSDEYPQNMQTQREKTKDQQDQNFNIRYSDNPKLKRTKQISKIQEVDIDQQNQSDKFSDNQMDSDSQAQDLSKQQFDKYMNGAKKMMIEFEKAYYGDQYEKKGTMYNKMKSIHNNQQKGSTRSIKKNSQVMACLRKKQLPDKVDIASKIQLNTRKYVDKRNIALNDNQISFSPLKNQVQKGINFDYRQIKLPSYQISNRMKSKSNSQPIKQQIKQNQIDNKKIYNLRSSKQFQKFDLEYQDQKPDDWAQQDSQVPSLNYFERNTDLDTNSDLHTNLKIINFHGFNKSKKLQKYESIEEHHENPNKLQTIAQTINQQPHFVVQNKSLRMMKSNHKHKRQIQKYLKDQNLQQKKEICIQEINFPLSVEMNNPRKSGKMIANVINHMKQMENQNITSSISSIYPKKNLESAMNKRAMQQKKSFTAHSNKYLPGTTKIAQNVNIQVNAKKNNTSQKESINSVQVRNIQTVSNNVISLQKVMKLKTITSEQYNQRKPFRKSAKSTATKQKMQNMIKEQKKINLNHTDFNDLGINGKKQISSQSSYLPKIRINTNIKKTERNNLINLQNSSSSTNYNHIHINNPLSSNSLPTNVNIISKDFLVIQSERRRYKQSKQSKLSKQQKNNSQLPQKFQKYQKKQVLERLNKFQNLQRFSIQNSQYKSKKDSQRFKDYQDQGQNDYRDEQIQYRTNNSPKK